MIYRIDYNSQRDNFDFNGKFKAWWQCFTTCSWMLMSHFCLSIDGEDDKGLAEYLDDVEDSIGKPGIAEKIRMKHNWIKGRTSFWWLVQQSGIQSWLEDRRGIQGSAIFEDKTIWFEELHFILDRSPVILQTDKLGGLHGGHIILAIGDQHYHDPFGDARTKYNNHNGKCVHYPDKWLKEYTGKYIRCIYWKK